MKKIIYFLVCSVIGLLFIACGKDEDPKPNHGSVSLNMTEVALSFGETVSLVPKTSEDGLAAGKTYKWSSSNEAIVSVKAASGGIGEVAANRVGEATITYEATDGTISAKCLVTVNPRNNIIGAPIFYKKGATKSDITLRGRGVLNDELTTAVLVYYDVQVTATEKVKQIIYELDSEGKLIATIAVLEDSGENKIKLEQYIEERYAEMENSIQDNITYYDAGVDSSYDTDTKAGVVLANSVLGHGLSIPLGIKFTSK